MNFKDLNKSFLPHPKFKRNLRRQTLCLCIAGITINSFAFNSVFQDKYDVNLSFDRVNIETALETISSQTGVKLAYNNRDVNTKKSVSVNINTSDIEEALIAVLGPDYSFKQVDDYIAIAKVTKKTAQPSREISQEQAIKGIIVDQNNEPLIGASIYVEGTRKGVTTDLDGNYQLNDIKKGEIVTISYIGYKTQKITYKGNNLQDFRIITMFDDSETLDEVQVVAFGKQKKASVLSSITSVKPGELKVPSSNLTTALAGRIAGVIAYQRSGEPGRDNAEFFVRGVTTFGYKKDPLVLLDNNEISSSDLARIQPDDIASFNIMKDAAATALYGSRGANGVILVTTKEGTEGKAKLNFRFEESISTPTKRVKLADPVIYMRLHNEAVRTRDPLGVTLYSQNKIDNTEKGSNPYVYPANDWYNIMFNNFTSNQRLNLNLSGGGKVARYYLAATLNNDNGNLKMDKLSNFNSNINLKRYMLRTNVNINVTPTTEVKVRLSGTFDDYKGPLDGGDKLYEKMMSANPVLFPPYFTKDKNNEFTNHILFGNYDKAQFMNPYAEMSKGYKDYSTSQMFAQFELEQKLDFITKGLSLRGLMNTSRYSYFDVQRYYNPFFYQVNSYDKYNDSYKLDLLNESSGTEYLDYKEGGKNVESATYFEASANWNRMFGEKHDFGAMLVFTMREFLSGNAGDLQSSLAVRNLNCAGRFTYGYDGRYYGELNFGYNGSERFSKKERFGFFPSGGIGWIISGEKFYAESLRKIMNKMKLKATYGLVGNDAIGGPNDRFFYLSNVNMNNNDKGASFGTYGNSGGLFLSGISIGRYPNDKITWEVARKLNVGVEIGLLDKLDIQADIFTEHRSNILMPRASIPQTMGLQSEISANLGKAQSSGFDMSVDYNQMIGKDFWISGRGNFTFAKSKFTVYEEPDYSKTPWKSRVGYSLNQTWGYVAERLFIDEEEIRNSPSQFGAYMAGDIKYKDINGDGKITDLDQVPIGHPTSPEIVYGFGASMGYKGFDLSCFFQGLARESFWINAEKTAPFINRQGALLDAYAQNHWSEENRNSYALWPRLSENQIENNTKTSSWFMQDGSFLRLKSLEVGYSLPSNITRKVRLSNVRVYLSGTNLLTFSKFKLWDPEMGGQGLGYPIQKVYNIGVQLSF